MSDFDPAEFLAAKTPAPGAAPATAAGFDPVAFLSPAAAPMSRNPTRPSLIGYGPGSVDPDEKPVTELGKVRGFGNFAPHPQMSTDSEHDAAMQRAAADSHLDDPGVQAIVGGVLGAGAGELVSSGLGAVAPRTITNIAAKGVEGGVQSKAQGGSFAQGALLGGGTAALPALGRVTASAGRSIGESSIARSEERALTSQAPVQDAIKKAAAEIKASATKTAQHAVLAELAGGGHSMLGHGVAGLSAAKNIGLPIARATGVAADEGIAAIARRVLGKGADAVAEDANPFRSELWGPRKNTPLPPSWSPRGGIGAPEELPGMPEISAPPVDPRIVQLQDALKTANPEQAEMINASIAGLMKRGASPATKAARPPIVQLAPSLDERAAATMGSISAPPSVHAEAQAAAIKSAKDALLSTHAPEAEPATMGAAPAAPLTFEPSKFDDKFARKLKMSVEDYRAMMNERLVTAQKTLNSPRATMAEKLRAAQLLRGRTNVPLPGEDDAGRPLEPDQPTMN